MTLRVADKLLGHIAHNPEIKADQPVLVQIVKQYVPSLWGSELIPAFSLKGRCIKLIRAFQERTSVEQRTIMIFRQAMESSQIPLANFKLMQAAYELCCKESFQFTNPSIVPLENHLTALAKQDEDRTATFSLLRPEVHRKKLIALAHDHLAIKNLAPSLSFNPQRLDEHIAAADLAPSLEISQLILSPIYTLNEAEFTSIASGTDFNEHSFSYLIEWLSKNPKLAHPQWRKLNLLLQQGEARNAQIRKQIDQLKTKNSKTTYLHDEVAVAWRDDVLNLQPQQSIVFKGATGTRVPSVQRLFQLVQQLPAEILEGLPEIVTSPEIYDNPQQFIAKKIRSWVENYSFSPLQKQILTALTEDADREFSDEFIEKMHLALPPPLHFLGDLFIALARPLYKKGIISAIEKIDEISPSYDALQLIALIAKVPGVTPSFVSGLILYYSTLALNIPRGKQLEILSWVRENIQRLTDSNLRENALDELETFTEELAGKPIQFFLAPLIEKVRSGLHVLYKNVLSPNIALALTQMTGIEHPFLSAPFYLKLTKQPDGKYTAHIYCSGHSLYYLQGENEQIRWPRVIGNIPSERLSIAFFQRLLDHTYRAQYDPSLPSAGEDLFGEQGTFETLSADYDHPDTIENAILKDLSSQDSYSTKEKRTFSQIIDSEWELAISVLTSDDPHLMLLHFRMDALISYCRQFVNLQTERLALPNSHHLEPILLEIEKDFQRHKDDLDETIRTHYEATLHDVRMAIVSVKISIEPIAHALPPSIANALRKGMDFLGIDSDDILEHKRTISWLFGEDIFAAAEFLLKSADRVSGITLHETEKMAIADLKDHVARMERCCSKFSSLSDEAHQTKDHFQGDPCKWRDFAQTDLALWKRIYKQKVDAILANPQLDAASIAYLKESCKRVNKGTFRRFEIDRVFSRVNDREPIKELYTILEFCRLLSCVSRRSNDLHRTLEKKQNYENAKQVLQRLGPQFPSQIVHLLEKEHFTHNDLREAESAIRIFKRICPQREHALQIEECFKNVQRIENAHSPAKSIFQSIYYTTLFKLLDLSLSLISNTGIARLIYAVCNILPTSIGTWLKTTYKNILRTLLQYLFILFLKFLAYKDLVSASHIQQIFSTKKELNLYAKEILAQKHIDYKLPRKIVMPDHLFKHLEHLLKTALDSAPPEIGIRLTHLKNEIHSKPPHNIEFLAKILKKSESIQRKLQNENIAVNEFTRRLSDYIASLNDAVEPILKQFSRFATVDEISYTLKPHLDTFCFDLYNLHFTVHHNHAYSTEFPGYFIAPNQNDLSITCFGSYLLLQNRSGERQLILPAANDFASISWNGLKHLGPLGNPLSHLLSFFNDLKSDNRKGENSYHIYCIDPQNRPVSENAESLAYLITVQMLQGNMPGAIHAGEQLYHLLEESESVDPDAEMILWPLMILPNTLEGKAALGPFNNIFHLRQKILAKLETKLNKEKKPVNNSGFVHAVFIIALLQDLHTRLKKTRPERTPHPQDNAEQQEFLLYKMLFRHVNAIVSQEFQPVDWFESKLLPPSMAKRYRDLAKQFKEAPASTNDHFLRDFLYSAGAPPTRNYFGAEESGSAPLQTMGILTHLHSDQIEPSIWRRIHTVFRSHVNAIRNPHLHCAALQASLQIAAPPMPPPLSPEFIKAKFLYLYEVAIGRHGAEARITLRRNLRVVKGGWDLQSRTLIDLLTTVSSAAQPLDKPITHLLSFLWKGFAKTNNPIYQAIKWGGLHPLGIITSPIYGMVNHKIWSSDFTKAAEGLTQFFGTGTNPPVELAIKVNKGTLSLPSHPPAKTIRLTGPLNTINKTIPSIQFNSSVGFIRSIKVHVMAALHLPFEATKQILSDERIHLTARSFPFRGHAGVPAFQIPHPLQQNYNEAIDNWPGLNPTTYFPSPDILRFLIQHGSNPKPFFELLHSKVHAYKIVHGYTRPIQKALVWFLEHPALAFIGGKKALYPLSVELLYRGAAKALAAWTTYYMPAPAHSLTVKHYIYFDFAALLTDENQTFKRIYSKLDQLVFSEGTNLRRGQPLALAYSALMNLKESLEQSINQNRKHLLKVLNPLAVRSIWRKPIDYEELLRSFFTGNDSGIIQDLRMAQEQTVALQSTLVRQISREIRLMTIKHRIAKVKDLSLELPSLLDLKEFFHTHFSYIQMPQFQRKLLCYEWFKASILRKEELKDVLSLLTNEKLYQGIVRQAVLQGSI